MTLLMEAWCSEIRSMFSVTQRTLKGAVIVMASAGEEQGGRNQRSDWEEPWRASGGIPHTRDESGSP